MSSYETELVSLNGFWHYMKRLSQLWLHWMGLCKEPPTYIEELNNLKKKYNIK